MTYYLQAGYYFAKKNAQSCDRCIHGMLWGTTCHTCTRLVKEMGEAPEINSFTRADQLRAECERRFGGESFKQSLEIVNCELKRTCEEHLQAERERDEWKARAEKAEAQVADPWSVSRPLRRWDDLADEERDRVRRMLYLDWVNTFQTPTPGDFALARGLISNGSAAESGPGIARLPEKSQPLAFLDEDLLADDA